MWLYFIKLNFAYNIWLFEACKGFTNNFHFVYLPVTLQINISQKRCTIGNSMQFFRCFAVSGSQLKISLCLKRAFHVSLKQLASFTLDRFFIRIGNNSESILICLCVLSADAYLCIAANYRCLCDISKYYQLSFCYIFSVFLVF